MVFVCSFLYLQSDAESWLGFTMASTSLTLFVSRTRLGTLISARILLRDMSISYWLTLLFECFLNDIQFRVFMSNTRRQLYFRAVNIGQVSIVVSRISMRCSCCRRFGNFSHRSAVRSVLYNWRIDGICWFASGRFRGCPFALRVEYAPLILSKFSSVSW